MVRSHRLLRVAVVVACGLWLATSAAVPTNAALPLTVVTVAGAGSVSHGPLFIADRQGYFARQGIRYESVMMASFGAASAPLIKGQIDVFSGVVDAAFFNAVAANQLLRIVASQGYYPANSRNSALVVRPDLYGADVKTVADLRGRKIGVNSIGGSSHYILTKMLAKGGLKLVDVEFVRLPFASMVAALLNRAIDAALMNEPFITQLEQLRGGVRLMGIGEAISGESATYLTFGSRLLTQDREVGKRFMLAYLQGVQQFRLGPTDRNVKILSEYLKIDENAVRQAGWVDMYPDARVNVHSIQRFQDWLYEIGSVQVRSPAAMLVDMSFTEHAATALNLR